jgi:hypothetical protein
MGPKGSLTCGGASYQVVRYQFDESGRGPESGVSQCSARAPLPLNRCRGTEHYDSTQRQVGCAPARHADPISPDVAMLSVGTTAGVVRGSAYTGASSVSARGGPVVRPMPTDPAVEKVKRVNDVDHRCLHAAGRAKRRSLVRIGGSA